MGTNIRVDTRDITPANMKAISMLNLSTKRPAIIGDTKMAGQPTKPETPIVVD